MSVKHQVKRRLGLIIALVLITAALAVMVPLWVEKTRKAESERNLYTILIALEDFRFSQAHTVPEGGPPPDVPLDLQPLIDQGVIELPDSPYTGKPMRLVRLSEDCRPGDFTYLPAMLRTDYRDGKPSDLTMGGYYFFVYGPTKVGTPDPRLHPLSQFGQRYNIIASTNSGGTRFGYLDPAAKWNDQTEGLRRALKRNGYDEAADWLEQAYEEYFREERAAKPH